MDQTFWGINPSACLHNFKNESVIFCTNSAKDLHYQCKSFALLVQIFALLVQPYFAQIVQIKPSARDPMEDSPQGKGEMGTKYFVSLGVC